LTALFPACRPASGANSTLRDLNKGKSRGKMAGPHALRGMLDNPGSGLYPVAPPGLRCVLFLPGLCPVSA
jgi:hypothetical protein